VTAGTGLSGGGTSGDVSLAVDTSAIQQRVAGTCPAGSSISQINLNGTVVCEPDDAGAGDITSVSAGTGLSGGGTAGDVSLAIAAGGVTSLQILNESVQGADILNGTITGGDIADGSIGSLDLGDGTVNSSKLADDSIQAVDLAPGAVGTSEVADGSVTAADLSDEAGADFSGGEQSVSLAAADAVVRSVTIVAPAAGTVLVNASGVFGFNDALTAEGARCSITATLTTLDFAHLIYASEAAAAALAFVPFAGSRGFPVAAGATTFNLRAGQDGCRAPTIPSEATGEDSRCAV
jgi:hypothetical protein